MENIHSLCNQLKVPLHNWVGHNAKQLELWMDLFQKHSLMMAVFVELFCMFSLKQNKEKLIFTDKLYNECFTTILIQ